MLHQDFKTSLDTISGVGGFGFFFCIHYAELLLFSSYSLALTEQKSHFSTDLSLIYWHDHVSSLTESIHFVSWVDWFVAVETVLHFLHEILAFHFHIYQRQCPGKWSGFFFSCAHIFCCHLLALCIKVKRLCVMIFLHSFYLCFLQYSLWRISRVFSIGIRRFCAKSVQSTDTVRGNIDCIKPNICLIPVLVSWYRRLISFLISKKEPILFFFYSDLFAYDSPQHSIR